MVCVSPGAYAVFFFFSTRRRTRILRSSVLLSGVSANHIEWRVCTVCPQLSSLFSHLEFGHYVMSPSYLAVLVRCLGVLSWRNAWSDYGCMFCVSRSHGAVLGLVVDMPVGVQRQGFGQTVEKTVVPQLQFFAGHRHPDLHGPDFSTDHRDSTIAVRIWWSMSLVCGSRRFSGASVEETVVSHSCSC